jgi:hypothetical protein
MKILGTIALLILTTVVGYVLSYPSVTVRYRLSVEIETPEGQKTGSSVVEVKYRLIPCPICNGGGPKLKRFVKGQAVDVDLGQRGRMYALLAGRDTSGAPDQGADPSEMFLRVLAPAGQEGTASSTRAIGRVSGTAEVPAKLLPFLVRFRDEKDPKTVEAVDPANLAASFGPGVSLKRVTIATTNDPVTTGIEQRLGWLADPKVLENPGWAQLPSLSQQAVMGLRTPIKLGH